jgi:hypothetical protein
VAVVLIVFVLALAAFLVAAGGGLGGFRRRNDEIAEFQDRQVDHQFEKPPNEGDLL